ncbi:TPA: pLS20_p028 family conjugation system transmembrane protein [Enterococcus faecalis]
MKTEEILKILETFSDYLHIADFMRDAGRRVLDLLVSFLLWIVDGLTGVMSEMLDFLGFYNDNSMQGKGSLLDTLISFKAFGVGLAILAVGLVLLLGKSNQTRDIPMNVLLLLLMSLMLPNIMRDGLKIINATVGDLDTKQESIGFSTFKENLTDIYLLADGEWKTTDPKIKNNLIDRKGFDINERITDPGDVKNGEVLKYKLVNKKSEEGKEVEELDEGGGGVLGWLIKSTFAPKYYRWRVNWLPLIITLSVLALSMLISLVRVGRLGIELAFNNLWANLVIFFSFRDTKRAKTVLMEIVGGFVMILSIYSMYYVFIKYNAFVFAQQSSMLAKLFAVIGGAWFIYDGPSIIQKTLGIDAGLSTAGSFVMGMGAKTAMDKMSSVVKTAAGAGTSGTVALAGFANGLRGSDMKNDENANLNQLNNRDNDPTNAEELNNELQGNEGKETEHNAPDKQQKEQNQEVPEETTVTGGKDLEEPNDPQISQEKNQNDASESTESSVEGDGTKKEQHTIDLPTETEKNQADEETSQLEQPKDNNHTAGEIQEPESLVTGKNTEAVEQQNQAEQQEEHHVSSGEQASPTEQSPTELVENPFKKKLNNMINTNKHQKNQKNPIGNQVDRYKRNKEFGQDVNEWLKQRKEQKKQQIPKDKRQKIRKAKHR